MLCTDFLRWFRYYYNYCSWLSYLSSQTFKNAGIVSTLLDTTVLETDWSFSWYAQSITQSFPTWNWFSCRLIPSLSLNMLAPKPVWRNVFVCFFSSGCRKGKTFLSFLDTVLSDSPFPSCFYWNPFPFTSSSHI